MKDFVKFKEVFNALLLEKQLDQIRIGIMKTHVNFLSYRRFGNVLQNRHGSQQQKIEELPESREK